MTKTASIKAAVTEQQREGLERAAREDDRSVAAIIRLAIDDYLRGRGKRRRGRS
jgi:hypothetical protein